MRHRLASIAVALSVTAAVGPAAARAAAPVVSITFDDALDSPEPAGTTRDRVDDISWHTLPPLHATYYLNSSIVGTKYGFSLARLQQMDAAGRELGGRTVNHADLAHVEDPDEVRREACGDRKALTPLPRCGGGTFDITAFAYTNGDYAGPDESLATACVAAAYTPACTLTNLPTLPLDPRLRYRIPAPASIDTINGSAHFTTLRNRLIAAERRGTTTGAATRPWLVLVFHHSARRPPATPTCCAPGAARSATTTSSRSSPTSGPSRPPAGSPSATSPRRSTPPTAR